MELTVEDVPSKNISNETKLWRNFRMRGEGNQRIQELLTYITIERKLGVSLGNISRSHPIASPKNPLIKDHRAL